MAKTLQPPALRPDVAAGSDLSVLEERAEEAAAVLAAMANAKRLLVLCHLVDGEKSVGDLAAIAGISQSALSQHLAKLRAEGIVTFRREAQTLFYRVHDARSERLLMVLRDIFCPELKESQP